ncbi:hypothetical protein C0J52_06148 [Blattella germanica]|nr:hypothetical protein C0J52_06148 [Blattella germanica]
MRKKNRSFVQGIFRMLVTVCVVVSIFIPAAFGQFDLYEVPEATLVALKPRGLRVSIPDEPGIKLFAFHGNVNKEMNGLEAGQMARDIIKPTNGRWVFQDDRVRLKVGDILNMLYTAVQKTLVDSSSTNPTVPQPPPTKPTTCEQSKTLMSGKPACQGQLIFEEDFNTLDSKKWAHDVKISGSPDFEFVAYTSDPGNSYVHDGILHVKPILTTEVYGENFVNQGNLQLNGCTGTPGSAECSKRAQGWDIIPPVLSSRLRTRNSFSFCYGKVEIRAKLPAGDWMVPELWLEPRDNLYGKEYLSGKIQMAMARGNKELFMQDDPQKHIGDRLLEAGCMLGVDQKITTLQKSFESLGSGWCNNFHIYTVEWLPGDVTFKVDGKVIGVISPPPGGFYNLPFFTGTKTPWGRGSKLAPFDSGIRNFPDNCTTGLPQGGLHPKPWFNTDPKAMLQFWRDRENWQRTWSGEDSHLQVDYVKRNLTLIKIDSGGKALMAVLGFGNILNWEFQVYLNNRSNSYAQNGKLFIKPTLTSDKCTNPSSWGCERVGTRTHIVNPVTSARIQTSNSFTIWLLPRDNEYGTWPASGEIDLVESKGNRNLVQNGRNIGTELTSSTLHFGPFFPKDAYQHALFQKQANSGEDYIKFSIDDEEYGRVNASEDGFWDIGDFNSTMGPVDNPWRNGSKMAPFDKEFYLILNLAVGGTNYYFPDNADNPGGKPWENTSKKALTDFWNGRNQWLPTWERDVNNGENAALQVEYIRVWAL